MSRVLFLTMVLAAALATGCGVEKDPNPGPRITPPPGLTPVRTVAPAEGRLNLIAPAGYADVGTFEATSGCKVSVTAASSSDDVVRLLSTGRYDGALGAGDATIRLVTAGDIAPVNTALIAPYAGVYPGLKQRPFNSVGGQMFAVPVGRATNVLVWARDQVPGTLNGLAAVLDPAQVASYGGQVIVPDDPDHIAEAALWELTERSDLKITDPYELDRRQFNAVIDVLRHQKPYVQSYWSADSEAIKAFATGDAIVGLVSQEAAQAIQAAAKPGEPFGEALPKEGAVGVSPAWMVAAKPAHPGCMYRWLAHVLDPQVQARVSTAVHIAPSNPAACDVLDQMGNTAFCDAYHAGDDGYWGAVLFRTSPARDCGDARGRVCVDWDGWRRAWKTLTASG